MSNGMGKQARGAWNWLRSARLALGVLSFFLIYALICGWLPWIADRTVSAPDWARAIRLDRPFSSPLFIACCLLLFCNTLACTWDRTRRLLGLWKGDVSSGNMLSWPGKAGDPQQFLISQGFSKRGDYFFRYRFSLWGGWVLHLGILLLLAGIAVQQSCFDGASFELVEGESINLAQPGAVFARDKGVLAPENPPAIQVGLLVFDPFMHQKGYAPDRASRVHIRDASGQDLDSWIDRAKGISSGPVTIFQAIPSGLALNLEIAGQGVRSIHLRDSGKKTAQAAVSTPDGAPARFTVTAERGLHDPLGTGALEVVLERNGERHKLTPGQTFAFGATQARLSQVSRWGGFTYARSPGVGIVFTGFAIILAGCLLLVFPFAVARVTDEGILLRAVRGREALELSWRDYVAGRNMKTGRN